MEIPYDLHGLTLKQLLENALREDVGDGDHTSLSTIDPKATSIAHVKVKDTGIISGLEIAVQIFELVDKNILCEVFFKDGDVVNFGDVVIKASGSVQSLLKAERLVLNIMQRMSGIATTTHKMMALIKHTSCKILDTRKTTPNFRVFEKLAVLTGGGVNHRFGLYDMILIKDNHVDAAGGITEALNNSNDYLKRTNKNLRIEIETRNIEEVQQAIHHGGLHRIMLDNFSPALLSEAVKLINHRFETEASGGITSDTIKEYAETGVDYISVGALTHSVRSLDISMKIQKK